jgi:2-methylcitrate dehydratase PrpD
MAHLQALGDWVAGLHFRDLPEATVRAARLQVLNMVAATHGAARYDDVRAVAAAVGGFAGPGRATVLATGARTGPADAALANASCAMAHDFDDIVWMGHTCHSAVFAPLAVAEHEAASSEAFLTAVVVANEVAGRLGATCFLGPLNGQMWTFIHLAGAAAATAKLLGLDAARTTHALAIALAQPNFALQPGFMAPTSKLLAAATPTATGIQAAYFARAGMTGAADILEDRRGFWHRFAFIPLPAMLGGLGTLWVTQTLTVKSYPGCHFFQTASTAIDAIQARAGSLAGRVRKVRVDTTKLGMEVTRFASDYAPTRGPITQVNVNFDLATTAAIHILAGRLTTVEMDPRLLAERTPAIRALVERTRVVHDPALTARVIEGARGLGVGRQALASLRPGDLVHLVRRYREEYRSTLVTPREVAGWLQVAGRRLARRGGARPDPGSAAPLYFPNRVTVELEGGRRETEQVDLPPGSFAAATCAAEVERKFLREAAPVLGAEGARAAHAAGLALPQTSVARLVAVSSLPRPASAA